MTLVEKAERVRERLDALNPHEGIWIVYYPRGGGPREMRSLGKQRPTGSANSHQSKTEYLMEALNSLHAKEWVPGWYVAQRKKP